MFPTWRRHGDFKLRQSLRNTRARRASRPRFDSLDARLLLAASPLDPAFGPALAGPLQTETSSYPYLTPQVAVGVQADGKIVEAQTQIVATGSGATSPLVVQRYNLDGSLDTTFGTNGQTEIPFDSGYNYAYALAHNLIIQADGGIVLAVNLTNSATYENRAFEGQLVRLTASGQLDAGFGTKGELAIPTNFDSSDALAQQSDGKILVAGSQATPFSPGAAPLVVLRVTTSGQLDPTFNQTGQLVVTPTNHPGNETDQFIDTADALATNSSGQIYLASDGFFATSFKSSVGQDDLTRIRTDGTLDSSFGTGGFLAQSTKTVGLGIQSDGKIVVNASGNDGTSLSRLLPNGQADPSFPTSNPAFAGLNQFVVAPNDMILGSKATSYDRIIVTRALADGTVDPSFGLKGIAEFSVAGALAAGVGANANLSVNSLALAPSGKIVVGSAASNLGTTARAQSVLAQLLPGSLPGGPPTNDYDGDGKTDVAAELTALGEFAYRKSTGGDVVESFGPGQSEPVLPAPGDYDGDGITDVAAYLPLQGVFAYRPSSGGPDVVFSFGTAGAGQSIPMPGDYDGDGKTDPAVYLVARGEVAYRPSSGGPDVRFAFGTPGAGQSIPAPGDYDGDGKTDPAVYLTATGTLAYRPSSGSGDVLRQFGTPGAGQTIPDPGDYDGDGKTDIAVYLPLQGVFAFKPSSGGTAVVFPFGTPGAGASIPVPGDYDGDGKTDVAVFFPGSATFAYRPSHGGSDSLQQFGMPGTNRTIPAAAVVPYAQTSASTSGSSNASVSIPAAGNGILIPLTEDLFSLTTNKKRISS